MNLKLKGRLALVTGSTHGLGRAIAEALAAEGVGIIINGRNEESVFEATFDISQKYEVETWACTVDVTDSNAVSNFFKDSVHRLDILVNNAGDIIKYGKFEDLTEDDWLDSFNLSLMGPVRFIKATLPYLKRSNQARIINISSLLAHQPSFTGNFPHHSASKAGLLNLGKSLAGYLGEYGIRINTVCPSTLAGGGWRNNIKDRAARDGTTDIEAELVMREEERHKSPLDNIGELEDVADLVVFLASAKSKFLTGHCYNVDGGITRST